MRICFFGDSFVQGTGDDDCLGWAGRLCRVARNEGHDVTFYNLGVRRDTSDDVAARWRREAEPRLPSGHTGGLVFSFGANDCSSDGATGARVGYEQALGNARMILAEASLWRPTLMIGPAPVSDDPVTDTRISALSSGLREVCASAGVPYLEIFGALQASEVWRSEATSGDGTHPNGGGYAALASMVSVWEGWRAWFATP